MEIRPPRAHRRLRSHDDGVDRWEMTEAAPAADLAGPIRSYCLYAEETNSFEARRELAATSGVMIVALGDPLEIVGADGAAITLQAGEAFVGGVADATSLSCGPGRQEGVHVFMPLASLAAVAGVPVAALANVVVPLHDLIGTAAVDLGGRLVEASDAEVRFGLLDAFVRARLAEEPTERAMAWAADRLAAAGRPATSDLAQALGWSRRHFARRFRNWSGFAPDRFRRIARFERFVGALQRRPGEGLAGLAADCGYADQAHLGHDVGDFAGMTPAQLRQRLIPAAGGVRD